MAPPPSAAAFMSRAPGPMNSNTLWGSSYALTLRNVVITHANNSPRNLQTHLGPSEIGTPCDRQVVGKLAGLPYTNHIADPWASIMGVAGHAWMSDAFNTDNERNTRPRWLAEFKVDPDGEHPGTGDLYDFVEQAVVDHKFLGDTSREHLIKNGPPRRYHVQVLKYARGFQRMGLSVVRVVLVAWPRTKSSLDKLYVWDHLITDADTHLLAEVDQQMRIRRAYATCITNGTLSLRDIPATPDDDECYFCPFFRSEAVTNPEAFGCPGHHLIPGRSKT